MRSSFRLWILVVCAGTIIMGTVYVIAQQMIRQSADDPQIEVARDAAVTLATDPSYVPSLRSAHVDMDMSLATFVIAFDDSGKVVSTTGYLDGRTPVPPQGVFDYAREHSEHRLTWQPAPGVRIATVVRHYSGEHSGFVLVGKSLVEAEDRIGQLGVLILVAWCAMWLGTAVIVFLTRLSAART